MNRTPRKKLASTPAVNQRRHRVLQWYMNGYMLDGKRMSIDELAAKEGCAIREIRHDLTKIKQKLAQHISTSESFRDRVLSTFNSSIEMSLQDRGRALEQFERLRDECIDPATGNWKKCVDKDIGFQMSAFLKLAQTSNEQFIKMIGLIVNRQDMVNILVQNNTTNVEIMTPERAVKILESCGSGNILPSIRYRNALAGKNENEMPLTLDLVEKEKVGA